VFIMPPSLASSVRCIQSIHRRRFFYEFGINDYNRILTVCCIHAPHNIIARRSTAGAKENA
jgi:hypothetical protein